MPQVALVTAADCIGCTLCQKACPTGAFAGSIRQLHTVVTNLCTGCGSCLPVCPPQCITMNAVPTHPLQETDSNGQLTPAAQKATARLTAAREAAKQHTKTRTTVTELPADLLALAQAARAKATEKYAHMGPLKKPRALPK